jgi:hypothetical protein
VNHPACLTGGGKWRLLSVDVGLVEPVRRPAGDRLTGASPAAQLPSLFLSKDHMSDLKPAAFEDHSQIKKHNDHTRQRHVVEDLLRSASGAAPATTPVSPASDGGACQMGRLDGNSRRTPQDGAMQRYIDLIRLG